MFGPLEQFELNYKFLDISYYKWDVATYTKELINSIAFDNLIQLYRFGIFVYTLLLIYRVVYIYIVSYRHYLLHRWFNFYLIIQKNCLVILILFYFLIIVLIFEYIFNFGYKIKNILNNFLKNWILFYNRNFIVLQQIIGNLLPQVILNIGVFQHLSFLHIDWEAFHWNLEFFQTRNQNMAILNYQTQHGLVDKHFYFSGPLTSSQLVDRSHMYNIDCMHNILEETAYDLYRDMDDEKQPNGTLVIPANLQNFIDYDDNDLNNNTVNYNDLNYNNYFDYNFDIPGIPNNNFVLNQQHNIFITFQNSQLPQKIKWSFGAFNYLILETQNPFLKRQASFDFFFSVGVTNAVNGLIQSK